MIKLFSIILLTFFVYHSVDSADTLKLLSAGGYQKSCAYGCQKGFVCLYNKCVCPNGYQYSETLGRCLECPGNWTVFKGLCLNFVLNDTTSFSWDDARTQCLNLGGDLYDVNPETHFEFLDSFVNYKNITTNFYVGVRGSEYGFENFTNVYSSNEIPADGTIWQCNNLKNSLRCKCSNLNYNQKLQYCEYDQENEVPFDDGLCKKCTYINTDLQLTPIDCGNDEQIQAFLCQRKNTNNYDYNLNRKSVNQVSNYMNKYRCNVDNQCPSGSTCLHNYCACSYGYYPYQDKCVSCPLGWSFNDGYCYYVSKTKTNWVAAARFCLSNKASLANLDRNQYSTFPTRLFHYTDLLDLDEPHWVGGYKDPFSVINNGSYYPDWLRLFDQSIIDTKAWIETSLSKCSYDDYYEYLNFDKNALAVDEPTQRLVRFGFEEELNFICQKELGVDLNETQINNINDVLSQYVRFGNFSNFEQFCLNSYLDPLTSDNSFSSPRNVSVGDSYEYCFFRITAPVDKNIMLYVESTGLGDYDTYIYITDGYNYYWPTYYGGSSQYTYTSYFLSSGRYLYIIFYTEVNVVDSPAFNFRFEYVDNSVTLPKSSNVNGPPKVNIPLELRKACAEKTDQNCFSKLKEIKNKFKNNTTIATVDDDFTTSIPL